MDYKYNLNPSKRDIVWGNIKISINGKGRAIKFKFNHATNNGQN
jgi:hypothetical protein